MFIIPAVHCADPHHRYALITGCQIISGFANRYETRSRYNGTGHTIPRARGLIGRGRKRLRDFLKMGLDLYDYMWSYIVMTVVKIARLKSHLSSYLRQVQKGEQIVVTDRETPIAKMVPYTSSTEKLQILSAKQNPTILKKLTIPATPKESDSLKALLEDRKDDLET